MSIVTQVDLLQVRRTKIVATLGPASDSPEVVGELIDAGADVFRLNMSHGDHESHRTVFGHIQTAARRRNKPVAVFADLCGPKIRTGKFAQPIELWAGQRVTVTTRDVVGTNELIPSQYAALAADVVPGSRVLLNDGAIELRVEAIEGSEIYCTVVFGGTLSSHKGINLPGVDVSAPSMTDKDRSDALFAIELGVDFLALSFVRKVEDVMELKTLIREQGASTRVISKIEKPEALREARGIVAASDAIMVARGDLGVELKPEEVPVAQSLLIDLARSQFKPVIVATQMLESMIENARPTRAEVTDIAYAVTLNTDAVMLSAETAVGLHPVESVAMMDRIARQTESHLWRNGAYGNPVKTDGILPVPIWSVVANATAAMSKNLMAHAVVVLSSTGTSAATVSSARPAAPILGISGNAATCRLMNLLWGVVPVLSENFEMEHPTELVRRVAGASEFCSKGEYVLMVRGFASDPRRNTPSVTAILI